MRPAAALQNARSPEVTEDLFEESLGDTLPARDLIDAHRRSTIVDRELH
jgi:hypothetical protein